MGTDTKRSTSAGPVGSTGFCDGQCCSGSCNYDSKTGKTYCCALVRSKFAHNITKGCLPVTHWCRWESKPGPCAGPPGSAGYCGGKCCSNTNGTCVSDSDNGGQQCCAPLVPLLSHQKPVNQLEQGRRVVLVCVHLNILDLPKHSCTPDRLAATGRG